MSKFLQGVLAAIAVPVIVGGALVLTGAISPSADSGRWPVVDTVLHLAADRGIEARTGEVTPPASLDDEALVTRGAGNYDAMCAECHEAPGAPATELGKRLNPHAPNLTRHAPDDAREP